MTIVNQAGYINQTFAFLDKQNEVEFQKNAVHSQVTGKYSQAYSEPCQHLKWIFLQK